MFSIAVVLIFFAVAIVLFNVIVPLCIIFAVVGGIWLLSETVGVYSCQLGDFSLVRQTKTTIKLFSERRENLVAIVRAELAKYPEYEKTIMGNITPTILFQFPVLKSNETIISTVEQVVRIEDDVYKLRSKLIEIQSNIYWREISPWTIYVTPYQRFFGEPNPVALTK